MDVGIRLPLITSPIPTSSISAAPAWPPSNSGAAVGIVVDAVSEVYSVVADAIQPVPELGGIADGSCVRGIATVDGKMVMLLDIDSLVAACVETDAPRSQNG